MRTIRFVGALLGVGLLLGAQKAEAAYTFATVGHSSSQADLSYVNGGASASLVNDGGTATSTIVSFNFSNDFPFALPPGVAPPQTANAYFTINATTTTPAVVTATNVIQDGITGSMEFRNIADGSLLLRVTFTDAEITGRVSSPTGSFTDAQFLTSNVVFTSDYFAVSPQVGNSFAIGLDNVTPVFGGTSGSFLTSFTANIGGPFSTGSRDFLTPTPAPQSLVLLLTAIPALGIGGYFYRRRLTVDSAALAD